MWTINKLFDVLSITRNLIYLTKFAKYNSAFFEFHSNKCYVKPQAYKLVLLEGFLDESKLYCFNNLSLESSSKSKTNKAQNICPIVNNTIVVHTSDNFVQLLRMFYLAF